MPLPNDLRTDANPPLTSVTTAAANFSLETAINSLTHAHWANQQREEPLCNAAMRYLAVSYLAPFPERFYDRR